MGGHFYFILIATACAITLCAASPVHVIGFRGAIDDATERCKRSAEVFGYPYTEIDLSAHNRLPQLVEEEVKIQKLKDLLVGILEEHILILDSHLSIILAQPKDLVQTANHLKVDYIFSTDSSNNNDGDLNNNSLFNGLFAKTKPFLEVISTSPSDILKNIKDAASSVLVDAQSNFFQEIDDDADDVNVRFEHDRGYLQNIRTDTIPVVAIASQTNGAKKKLNGLSNYLTRSWSPETGCQICEDQKIDLEMMETTDYPVVMLSLFVSRATPFLQTALERISELDYPKTKIHLTTHCVVPEQQHFIQEFMEQHGSQYRSVKDVDSNVYGTQVDSFSHVANLCLEKDDCQNLFYVDATAQFTWPGTLKHLVSANRSVVAPLMTRHKTFWSTFWGDVAADGSYKRSDDYFDIVERRKVGIWNVPLVGSVFLLSRYSLSEITTNLIDEPFFYLAISKTAQRMNVFTYIDNRQQFGHLTNPTNFTTQHLHNDLWTIFDNPQDWEDRYIHREYFKFAEKNVTMNDFEQPCTDIFWVPLMSERFCKELVQEMEHFGQWSDGTNYDPRLEGGYEAVPTRDIHMRQIDWEEHWQHVLRTYMYPIQIKLFEGYVDQPWARMNFVVRYKPDEQPSLNFHHDASTYTLDMALNQVHVDYEGGGVNYPRYNCKLVETRVGWPLVFPGRLTHLHEGMETTKGIRYIFVTFVNP